MTEISETFKLWRIRKTLMQMCHDRGYLVTCVDLGETLEEFHSQFGDTPERNDLTANFVHAIESSNQMCVFFPSESRITKNMIDLNLKSWMDAKVSSVIIVARMPVPNVTKTAIEDLAIKHNLTIEIFLERELLVNITDHVMVPEHVVLTPDEKIALLKKYGMKGEEAKLPQLLVTDPIARYFGVKKGQVVKIIRKSETAGRYITYRLVS